MQQEISDIARGLERTKNPGLGTFPVELRVLKPDGKEQLEDYNNSYQLPYKETMNMGLWYRVKAIIPGKSIVMVPAEPTRFRQPVLVTSDTRFLG